jgi:para-nitrobenzyl esterase
VAALKWVRENISAFGGDPDNVTIAGQSAGASSVMALLTSRAAHGLFRRAIAQSPALGVPPLTRGEAAWHTHQYLELLGLRPSTVTQLRGMPVGSLLRAARKLEEQEARAFHAHPVLQLVREGETIIDPPLEAAAAGAGKDVDVLIGVNREEMMAEPTGRRPVVTDVLERYRTVFFDDVEAVYRDYAAARPGGTPAQILTDLSGDRLFRMPVLRFAEMRDASGHPAYVYQFDWQSPAGMGACHGLELPFVFDNFAAWRNAPALKGLDTKRVGPLAQAVQQAWISFARSGNPNHPAMPHWEPYTVARRTTMRIDTVLEAVSDLAGSIKRQRWEAIIRQESRPFGTAGRGAA